MRRNVENSYIGKWRIVWMDTWAQDYVDMEVPGYFAFEKKGLGDFQFGLVQGGMDWKVQDERLEFSWDGVDEGNQITGRGWAEIEAGELHGHIFIHFGDDSAFRAIRQEESAET